MMHMNDRNDVSFCLSITGRPSKKTSRNAVTARSTSSCMVAPVSCSQGRTDPPELASADTMPWYHQGSMSPKIAIDRQRLADFCRRHHIRRLALFGSVLRDDFTPQSDVDVLVEFEAGRTPGFAFVRMQDELSEILGRRVDLNTVNSLSKYFRAQVLAEAESLD